MHLLILDNRDSFVWNLAQTFATVGAKTTVVRSDADTVTQTLDEASATFDAVVVSPGPGRPTEAGKSLAAIRQLHGHMPILGVCLGHQAIGEVFGATLRRSTPCHGKAWPVIHRSSRLLSELPSPFLACRYHSLALQPDSLPEALLATAWTPEGDVMAVEHRDAPTFGLQFHPESFRTEHGARILSAYLNVISSR